MREARMLKSHPAYFPPIRVNMPQWSRDGNRIACMTRTQVGLWQASLISAQGGSLISLLEGGAASADPVWSPSGDRIAFGSVPNPDIGIEATIQLIELQSKKIQVVPGSQGFNSPRWSPDGRFLAAVKWGTMELAFYDFATGAWRKIPGTRVGYLN